MLCKCSGKYIDIYFILKITCSVFFSPFRDPLAAGTDAFLQCWDGLQAYAFPPWSILLKVLAKLRVSPGLELTLIAPY